jgi:pyrroline-5-carboxylate reductase
VGGFEETVGAKSSGLGLELVRHLDIDIRRGILPTQPVNVAFIGAGNMASSLIQGLLNAGTPAECIHAADPQPDQLAKLGAEGVNTYAANNEAIAGADAVVLAVKPQLAGNVVCALTLQSRQVLVSIAAGINLASLTRWTAPTQPIVRCMPNTPALLGAGMSAAYANPACTDAHRALAQSILQAGGKALWVDDEVQLDAVTAVSGSGPAYFFQLMEAMIDAGVGLGLSTETATTLTIETAYGAALMARAGQDSPGQLRQNVTSPGGTTAAALAVMTERGLPQIVQQAVFAASQRAAELADEFGGAP